MKEKSLYNTARLMIQRSPPEEIGSLTAAGIARKFNVNRSYLSRCFSKYSFFTFQQYLELYTLIRFESAAIGLQKPTVKEVLKRMNIKNTSYFIRKYKKRFKKTPGQYCKELRERRKAFAREWKLAKKKRKK